MNATKNQQNFEEMTLITAMLFREPKDRSGSNQELYRKFKEIAQVGSDDPLNSCIGMILGYNKYQESSQVRIEFLKNLLMAGLSPKFAKWAYRELFSIGLHDEDIFRMLHRTAAVATTKTEGDVPCLVRSDAPNGRVEAWVLTGLFAGRLIVINSKNIVLTPKHGDSVWTEFLRD